MDHPTPEHFAEYVASGEVSGYVDTGIEHGVDQLLDSLLQTPPDFDPTLVLLLKESDSFLKRFNGFGGGRILRHVGSSLAGIGHAPGCYRTAGAPPFSHLGQRVRTAHIDGSRRAVGVADDA